MSLIRNTAAGIAGFVVRYASLGSREWARAIQSELDSIEEDWRALAWALGGLRVLLVWEPEPLKSLADLDLAAEQYADRRRNAVNNVWLARNLPWLVEIVGAVSRLSAILRGRDVLGNLLFASGFLALAGANYLVSREPQVPDRDEQAELIRFYVKELAAFSSLRSASLWMVLAGLSLAAAGFLAMTHLVWVRILCVPTLLNALYFAAKHRQKRRRLAQIQAMLPTISDR